MKLFQIIDDIYKIKYTGYKGDLFYHGFMISESKVTVKKDNFTLSIIKMNDEQYMIELEDYSKVFECMVYPNDLIILNNSFRISGTELIKILSDIKEYAEKIVDIWYLNYQRRSKMYKKLTDELLEIL